MRKRSPRRSSRFQRATESTNARPIEAGRYYQHQISLQGRARYGGGVRGHSFRRIEQMRQEDTEGNETNFGEVRYHPEIMVHRDETVSQSHSVSHHKSMKGFVWDRVGGGRGDRGLGRGLAAILDALRINYLSSYLIYCSIFSIAAVPITSMSSDKMTRTDVVNHVELSCLSM